uniref:Uncharacterized protein n=1 Tax=Anguilla anguilla TaxID=7936 RepID=A0A0E9TRE5_ANGAN
MKSAGVAHARSRSSFTLVGINTLINSYVIRSIRSRQKTECKHTKKGTLSKTATLVWTKKTN